MDPGRPGAGHELETPAAKPGRRGSLDLEAVDVTASAQVHAITHLTVPHCTLLPCCVYCSCFSFLKRGSISKRRT